MRVVCAWCGLILSDATGPISHGICPSCSMAVERAFHRGLAASRTNRRRRRASARNSTMPLPGFFPAAEGR